jgi:hypothetical protein
VVNVGIENVGVGYHVVAAKTSDHRGGKEIPCSTNDQLSNLERAWKPSFCPFSTTTAVVVAKAR